MLSWFNCYVLHEDGPDLPIAAIKINETHSMLIGEYSSSDEIAKTWFDLSNSVELITGDYNYGILDSVEILDKEGTAWISGKLL